MENYFSEQKLHSVQSICCGKLKSLNASGYVKRDKGKITVVQLVDKWLILICFTLSYHWKYQGWPQRRSRVVCCYLWFLRYRCEMGDTYVCLIYNILFLSQTHVVHRMFYFMHRLGYVWKNIHLLILKYLWKTIVVKCFVWRFIFVHFEDL